MKRKIDLVLILLIQVFLSFSCAKNPAATSKLPNVEFKDLAGRTVKINEFHGKALLVNFWATSCPPCLVEIPMLNELHRKYGKDLVIIGVSLDPDGAEAVKAFSKEVPIEYKSFFPTPSVEKKFAIWAIPTSYFYDRQGNQVERIIGLQTREFLEKTIQTTIAHQS